MTAVMSQPYLFEKPAAVRDGLVVSLGVGLVAAEGEQHKVRVQTSGRNYSADNLTETEEASNPYLRPKP